jgi:hypothetical protein
MVRDDEKGNRMKRRLTLGTIALLAALVVLVLTTTAAFAHERRLVAGKYAFVVGFLDEPAYANFKNGLDLTICNGTECQSTVQNGVSTLSNPVEGAEKTLKAEVSMGGSAPLALTLEPRFRAPGKYNGYFQPTKTGDYTFHIFGTIGNDPIDEKFTSKPGGFSAVEQIQTYPSVSPDLDATALKNQAQTAQNNATTATTIGIVGVVLGVLGLAVAGFALARKPKIAGASDTSTTTPAESLRG